MALIKPFVTKKFTAYAGDTRTSTVSLAIWLVDEVTQQSAATAVTVSLKEITRKPIKNPSGYYCFTDLAAGNYTVVVEPDPMQSGWYFQEEVSVTIPMPKRSEPVQEIILKPTPAYPFPYLLTLVRGFVTERTNGNRIQLNNIPVYRLKENDERDVESKTTHNGEFVLYIKDFVVEEGQNGMEITIEAEKDGVKEQRKFSIQQEGATVIIDIEFTT
jgi:hypothetical protein